MGLAKIVGLPHLGDVWYAWVREDVESGSCVRSSLRDRSPYGRRRAGGFDLECGCATLKG